MNSVPDKEAIRDAARRARAHFASDAVMAAEAAEAVARHVKAVLAPRDGPLIIAGYMPIGTEMDVRPLMRDLERLGHELALPTVVDHDTPIVFRAWGDGDELVSAAFDTLEPSSEAPERTPDVVLTPLLAYDRDAFRLGYGKGCYDRTLTGLRARDGEAGNVQRNILAIGIAWSGQSVDHLPVEDHDAPLDLIATEVGIFVPGAVTGVERNPDAELNIEKDEI